MTATAIPLRSLCRIDLRHIPEANLTLGHLHGGFDSATVLAAVESAYADGTLAPGRDRVTVIDPLIALDMVDVDEIYAVQRRISVLESAAPRRRPFRAVFVAAPVHSAIALHIYELLWERDGRVLPEFCHVSSLALAGTLLGYPRLADVAALA